MAHTPEGSRALGPSLWRLLDAAVSARGEALCERVARTLLELVGMRAVLVAERVSADGLCTLASFVDGNPLKQTEYGVRGTPFESVLQNGSSMKTHGAASLFSGHALLDDFQVESYVGVAIRSGQGATLGVLAVFDSSAHAELTEATILLQAASRVLAAEIERMQDQRLLRRQLRLAVDDHEFELKFQRAKNFESLGSLAGGIAHEFNNLLVGILGNVDLCLLDLPENSELAPILEEARESALRAAQLTGHMLAYSGRGRFVTRRLNLNDLVLERTRDRESFTSKHIDLRLTLAPDLPDIDADPAQVGQILFQLLQNGKDAVDGNSGVITIATGVMDADRQYLETTYLGEPLPEGRYVYLEVSDTGCGMDGETAARIFEPFYTTKSMRQGLGLAAVLGIVRGHRGGIEVNSAPGHGCTFRVLLPCGDPTQELVSSGLDPVTVVSEQRLVLVADDEASVRKVAGRVLRRSGYEVLFAVDGAEAIQLYAQKADAIALVLLDMTMPGLHGSQVLEELRRIRPEVRVVLTTGYDEQDATSEFVRGGLAGFLHKPWLPADLLGVVRQALGSSPSR